MSTVAKPPLRLGELLVNKGIITPDQLRIGLTEQSKRSEKLGKVLIGLGFATERIIRDVLSEALDQESLELSTVVADSEALRLLSKNAARQYNVLPVSFDSSTCHLTLAMSDTFNIAVLDKIRTAVGKGMTIKPVLAGEAEITTAIDRLYGYELSVDGILHEIETGEIDHANLHTGRETYSQPLVRLVDAMLTDAVKRDASDIHFEPENGFLRIRYRIDGVLQQIRSLHKDHWPAIAVRLKVMASMNIAESRAPQDGRFSLSISGRTVDFRASVQPTTHGENIVLRVLDRHQSVVSLDRLGLDENALALLKLMMARPEGMILITGPTGSGKTTTLYSMLNHISTESINVMTLEDPVEYPMPLVRQTSVNEAVKLDFANGIRSILRQDPDVILIGEIRDEATAHMALRAAMTGHQVYSTLHTHSALGAIPRLRDIGIPPDILAGNIIGVVAQRLIRKLCPHCKQAYQPDELEQRLLGSDAVGACPIYRPGVCSQCDHTGYKGRLAVMELIKFDGEMDEAIARRTGLRELQALALNKGFQTLAGDGSRRVLDGVTSLAELSRVIDLTERLK